MNAFDPRDTETERSSDTAVPTVPSRPAPPVPLKRDLIAGLEYQHLDLGTQLHNSRLDAFSACPPGVNCRNVSATQDIVRFRLSVKINPFAPAGVIPTAVASPPGGGVAYTAAGSAKSRTTHTIRRIAAIVTTA